MRYYKHINDNYIDCIGTEDGEGVDISLSEYDNIIKIFSNKPPDTETHYYMLRADTLEYEIIERSEPIVLPKPTYTLDEAATILAQEVSA